MSRDDEHEAPQVMTTSLSDYAKPAQRLSVAKTLSVRFVDRLVRELLREEAHDFRASAFAPCCDDLREIRIAHKFSQRYVKHRA